MGPGDLGILLELVGLLAGVGVLAGAFAGAYFFGKSGAVGVAEEVSADLDDQIAACSSA